MINYPTSLDNFTNPTTADTLDNPPHATQHADINDAVEALEAKVGIGLSPAGSATSGQVLTAQGGGTAIWDNLPADTSGLVHINTTSFTSVASISVPDDTFTATYDNYKVIMYLTSTSGSNTLRFRIRAAGSDLSTSTYRHVTFYTSSASNAFTGLESNSASNYASLSYTGVQGNGIEFDIFNPKKADYTHIRSSSSFADTTNAFYLANAIVVNNTTSYDAFTVYPAAQNITGSIRVYGYKN